MMKLVAMKKAAAILAATAAVALSGAAAASATPSGSTVNGCRAQYFTTSFSTKCWPATASQQYSTTGWCDYQPTVSGPWVYVGSGSYVNGISSDDCIWGVYHAQTYAR